MGFDPDNLESTIIKFGDQTEKYTDEEEQAIQNYYDIIDKDEEMIPFRKYAQKNFVIVGLRICQLDARQHYKCVKALHYHATKTYPELFAQMDPMSLKPIIEQKLFQVVRRPVDQGPAIAVFRVQNWTPALASLEQLALAGSLYVYAISKISPEIQRQGLIFITDISGFKFVHARQGSVDLVLKALRLYTTMPPMVKGMVAVNSFSLFEKTYKMFKWMLPEEIRNVVHITKNDMSIITKLASPDRLPAEFGGTMPDDEAYMEGLEEDILKDPELFELIKHVQDVFLAKAGMKRTQKASKNSKK